MNKILVLGGSNFIGRNLMEKLIALNRYEITTFNRGASNADLFPEVNKIIGDRNTDDIQLISHTKWDFVIDLSCYFPKALDRVLEHINPSIKKYIFISSCSVYNVDVEKSYLRAEDSLTFGCSEKESSDTTDATYGNRKAECERRLQKSSLPYCIFRPSLVFGKYDYTDRFYYWLYQIKTQREILIPNQGTQPFSITFVDDLIASIIQSMQADQESEVYNITSFPTISISQIVDSASIILNKNPKYYFADSDFLNAELISEWIDLPLWLNCDYFTYDNSKLVSNFKFIPTGFESGMKDTINYYDSLDWPVPNFGITEARKMSLIHALQALDH